MSITWFHSFRYNIRLRQAKIKESEILDFVRKAKWVLEWHDLYTIVLKYHKPKTCVCLVFKINVAKKSFFLFVNCATIAAINILRRYNTNWFKKKVKCTISNRLALVSCFCSLRLNRLWVCFGGKSEWLLHWSPDSTVMTTWLFLKYKHSTHYYFDYQKVKLLLIF